ncbi:unnamed protein product [Ceutorhynchus assimilis]|uniref:Myb/SANT-like DNA-binding domain-containing protein n=1 Tax=Ceutorhynchus assimilis TaxID=467358 RepID=A0A9N9QI61_9CUCU|nr:unnamed protein product [Ceutorhynchus assimilis]
MDLKEVDFGSHEVIYVTRAEERPTVAEWPNAAIEELLKFLKKHYRSEGNNSKFGYKRILYENCSRALRQKGFIYASAQCENKWKSLKRRYLTCLNRSRTGKGRKKIPYKKQLFDDEIEYLLKFEKQPQIKKEPGDTKHKIKFDEDMDQADEFEENNKKYMANDKKLVQKKLRGSDDEDKKDFVFTGKVDLSQQKKKEACAENPKANNLHLIGDLTKAMISNVEVNTDILKSHGAFCEQLLVCLDSFDRKAEVKIGVEQKMLEQKKIQNTLLARIVQKLGNSTSKGNV